MKIRMTETYLLEADSIETAEREYVNSWADEWLYETEFESVKFTEATEEKEYEDMVTIPLKEYTELVRKAYAFDIVKAKETKSGYHTDLEKAIFGFEDEEPAGGESDAEKL